MGREDLVCARCAAPVSAGRCSSCREAREQLQAAQRVRAAVVACATGLVAAVVLVFSDLARAGA